MLVGLLLILGSAASPAQTQPVTDDEIRDRLIKQSIRSYPGNCPCPYNLASNGSRCGGRSAYSRPGGHSPLCYARDVSDQRVQQYREQHGLEPPES
jgi:hypothetical protein